jgi:hypothetical protein
LADEPAEADEPADEDVKPDEPADEDVEAERNTRAGVGAAMDSAILSDEEAAIDR